MQFELDKWYMDAVADDGRAVIAYRARLRIGIATLGYSAILTRTAAGELESRSAASSGDEVEPADDGWSWRAPRWGFGGVWRPRVAPCERTLLDGPDGSVVWCCEAPAAEAEIRDGDEAWRGLGYVERLRMSVPPWRAPIDVLHWGRWIGRERSAAWIVWEGPAPLELILLDGEPVPGASLGPGVVRFGRSGVLRLTPADVLRDAAIGETVLHLLPVLRTLAPRATLGVWERKELARGELVSGGAADAGWAICERVDLRGGS